MPIHDLGYRGWDGERSSDATRWWVISQTGIALAWRSSWLKRMLFFSWLPILMFAAGIFFYEQAIKQSPGALSFVVDLIEAFDTGSGWREPIIAP